MTTQEAQRAVAICKDEVEKLIGAGTLQAMDAGSVWGRAFIAICCRHVTTPAGLPYRCIDYPSCKCTPYEACT